MSSRPVFFDLSKEIKLSANIDSFSDRDAAQMLRKLIERFQPVQKGPERERYLDAADVVLKQANQ